MNSQQDKNHNHTLSDIELYITAREEVYGDLTIDEFFEARIAFSEDNLDYAESARLRRIADVLGQIGVLGDHEVTSSDNVVDLFERKYRRPSK